MMPSVGNAVRILSETCLMNVQWLGINSCRDVLEQWTIAHRDPTKNPWRIENPHHSWLNLSGQQSSLKAHHGRGGTWGRLLESGTQCGRLMGLRGMVHDVGPGVDHVHPSGT